MNRIDYNTSMVASFREQVRAYIVPLCNDLYRKQSEQIGIDSLKFYDEGFHFKSGNASPKGSSDWIITKGQIMYAELSTDTNHFYNYMVNHHLMDLEAKENKEIGGYCTYIEDYQSPFIFANFNGTANDINVLTHEFGHSFQKYCSRNFEISEYYYPTKETAEIASMSMEFFTWPWIKLFFEGDADKYKYAHLKEAVTMIPYVVAVDEFQHLVYENPDWTSAERHEAWRKLEEVYLPHRNYDGDTYLEAGGYWQRQLHIYEDPFYFIDYSLAQIIAFQFWIQDEVNHEKAWQDFVCLCQAGGSKSFLQLIEEAKLLSPFEKETIPTIMEAIQDWFHKMDEKGF